MGTRSVVARPAGDGFEGRYVHWDGYPSGVGKSLWDAHRTRFNSDTDEMVRYLIDEEPVGWSALAGIDWNQPKGWTNGDELPCTVCGRDNWEHYAQYYPEGGPTDPMVNGMRRAGLVKPDEVLQFGHGYEAPRVVTGPQSYTCRGETGEQVISSEGDDCGTEWAYVIAPHALYVFERRFGQPGSDDGHGTGMFGYGASDTETGGYWAPVAECRWTDSEPDWDTLDNGKEG